jgi:hypothetical protein
MGKREHRIAGHDRQPVLGPHHDHVYVQGTRTVRPGRITLATGTPFELVGPAEPVVGRHPVAHHEDGRVEVRRLVRVAPRGRLVDAGCHDQNVG